MPRRLLPLVSRHEPPTPYRHQLKSAIGASLAISAIGGLSLITDLPLLFAPFGATAVLIFGQAASPLAQPANVVGGYLLATLVGIAAMLLFPHIWWITPIAVGVAIGLMLVLRVTHPPAGAVPIVVFASSIDVLTLLSVVVLGSITLVGIGLLHHWIPPRQAYPRPTGQS